LSRAEACATIAEAIAGMTSFDEIDGFSKCLRDPPPGVIVKPVTEAEWQMIANKRIALQRKTVAR
jgi:hypothetical protein